MSSPHVLETIINSSLYVEPDFDWKWENVNRVKDTDFGDIFDLSPISVLFTQGSNRDISSIANCDDIE